MSDENVLVTAQTAWNAPAYRCERLHHVWSHEQAPLGVALKVLLASDGAVVVSDGFVQFNTELLRAVIVVLAHKPDRSGGVEALHQHSIANDLGLDEPLESLVEKTVKFKVELKDDRHKVVALRSFVIPVG